MIRKIYLRNMDVSHLKDANPYTTIKEEYSRSNFILAKYPYYNYYIKKISDIVYVNDSSSINEKFEIRPNEVCIILTKGCIKTLLSNILYSSNRKYLYIDENVAKYDTEKTWNTIFNKIDFPYTSKIYFIFPDFSKVVFAYRINELFNSIEIEDKTFK